MFGTSDWIAAVGYGIASAIVVCALHGFTPISKSSKFVRTVFVLVGVLVGWCSVVDESLWFEHCSHCREHRYVREIRMFGLPIWEQRAENHIGITERLRTDLGFPCEHKFDNRMHLVRKWGLVHAARPRSGITCCLVDEPVYYDNLVAQQTRRFAQENPIEARQLAQRVVNDNNFDEMHDFIAAMKRNISEETRKLN